MSWNVGQLLCAEANRFQCAACVQAVQIGLSATFAQLKHAAETQSTSVEDTSQNSSQ